MYLQIKNCAIEIIHDCFQGWDVGQNAYEYHASTLDVQSGGFSLYSTFTSWF